MADSLRLSVLKALTAHVAGINRLDGYNFDLKNAVFRGRNRFSENDPSTMVSILENPRPDYGNTVGDKTTRSETWPLMMQGWCPDDPQNPSDNVYGLLDDVERHLARIIAEDKFTGTPTFPAEYMLGNLITALEITPGVVRPPTDGISSRSFFYLPLRVGLAVDLA